MFFGGFVYFWLLGFLLVLVSCGHLEKVDSTVDQELILKETRELSSDKMEGRAPGTRGGKLGRDYIVNKFKEYGLKPYKNKWQQEFELIRIESVLSKQLKVSTGKETVIWNKEDDFVGFSGAPDSFLKFSQEELVFVGYGIQSKKYDWDDFKGLNVKGKILIFLNNDPSHDPKLFAGKERLYDGRYYYKWEKAKELGAKGAIVIHTRESAGYHWRPTVVNHWSQPSYFVKGSTRLAVPLILWARESSIKKVFKISGIDYAAAVKKAQTREFKPITLKAKFSGQVKTKRTLIKTANVLGVINGTDPKAKDEWVIFTAHHDHIGIKKNKKHQKDPIYNGALDNALSVSGLFALIRQFQNNGLKPKRSVMFLSVGAEEVGKLGSEYFVNSQLIPNNQILLNMNIELGNITEKSRDVPIIGYGRTNLDSYIDVFAKAQNRRATADPFPDLGSYYRSDQFNFAKAGIPAIWIMGGVEFKSQTREEGKKRLMAWVKEHYHSPSDEVRDDWNIEGFAQDLQIMYQLTWNILQGNINPKWTSGSEFSRQ